MSTPRVSDELLGIYIARLDDRDESDFTEDDEDKAFLALDLCDARARIAELERELAAERAR